MNQSDELFSILDRLFVKESVNKNMTLQEKTDFSISKYRDGLWVFRIVHGKENWQLNNLDTEWFGTSVVDAVKNFLVYAAEREIRVPLLSRNI